MSGTTGTPLLPPRNTSAVSGRTPRRPARAPTHRIRDLNNKNLKLTTYLVPRLPRSPELHIRPHSDPPPSSSSRRRTSPDLFPARISVGQRGHPRHPMLHDRGHLNHHTAAPGLRTGRSRLDNTDGCYPVGSPHGPDTILIALVGPASSMPRATRFE